MYGSNYTDPKRKKTPGSTAFPVQGFGIGAPSSSPDRQAIFGTRNAPNIGNLHSGAPAEQNSLAPAMPSLVAQSQRGGQARPPAAPYRSQVGPSQPSSMTASAYSPPPQPSSLMSEQRPMPPGMGLPPGMQAERPYRPGPEQQRQGLQPYVGNQRQGMPQLQKPGYWTRDPDAARRAARDESEGWLDSPLGAGGRPPEQGAAPPPYQPKLPGGDLGDWDAPGGWGEGSWGGNAAITPPTPREQQENRWAQLDETRTRPLTPKQIKRREKKRREFDKAEKKLKESYAGKPQDLIAKGPPPAWASIGLPGRPRPVSYEIPAGLDMKGRPDWVYKHWRQMAGKDRPSWTQFLNGTTDAFLTQNWPGRGGSQLVPYTHTTTGPGQIPGMAWDSPHNK